MTLYTAHQQIGGLAPNGAGVLVGSFDGIEEVPFEGTPANLTTVEAANGLLIAAGDVYFNVTDPSPGFPTGLYSMSLQGSVPMAVPGFSTGLITGPPGQASDGVALYFYDLESFQVVIPGGQTSTIPLPFGMSVNAIAVFDGWLYATALDLTQGLDSLSNGVILRVPTSGGAIQELLTGIGPPYSLAVGQAGLFWAESSTTGPSYSGLGSTRRANLDGSSPSTVLPVPAGSLALSGDTLLFGTGETIGAVSTDGTDLVTLANGLAGPQLIVVGGNVVWYSPGEETLTGGIPQVVATACIP